MGDVRVTDPATLSEYGTNWQAKAKLYNDAIDSIYAIIGDLKENWSGSKTESFMSYFDKVKHEYLEFGTTLTNFGALVKETGDVYQKF